MPRTRTGRTFRGVWSRRGTLLPLGLLTVVVTAGTVAALGLAGPTGTPWSLVLPLLLLGLVAVPAAGRELASVRRGEIAVARLRGVVGTQLAMVMATEPLIVLVLGALVGAVVGLASAYAAGQLLVQHATPEVGWTFLTAVASVVVVGLLGVLLGMAGSLREPLNLQVSVAERPARPGVWAVFGHILVIVAALVGLYRATAESADPDWVVLATPALVGLALGQIAVWVIQGTAAIAVRRTKGSGLTSFLTSRRLARVRDGVAPLRLVIAAAVVAGTSTSAALQIGHYAEQTARLEAVGPSQVQVEGDARAALEISHSLDPEGRYLMAAVVVPGEGSEPARRVFLDLARYDAVVGGFLDDTDFAPAVDKLGGLPSDIPPTPSGTSLEVTVSGVSARDRGTLRPRVVLTLRTPQERIVKAVAEADIPADGGPVTVTVPAKGCAQGCQPAGVDGQRTRGDRDLPWLLTSIRLGGTEFADADFQRVSQGFFYRDSGPYVTAEGLMFTALPPGDQTQSARVGDVNAPRPRIITTPRIQWPDGEGPYVETTGGVDRPATVVGSAVGLPMVVGAGILADLPTTLVEDLPTVPAAHSAIVIAADTPRSLIDRVTKEAGHRPRSYQQYAESAARAVGADRARVYSGMALFCVLVSILVLAAAVSRQRRALATEVAALRVVGVARSAVAAVGRRELAVLTIAGTVATLVGSVICIELLVSRLPLVHVPTFGLPADFGLGWLPLSVAGGLAAAVAWVVGSRGKRVGARESRPAIMREAL
jgi:hypothetical protein